MTSSNLDKTLATLICVFAIGGFLLHPNASAAPVFPPAHLTPSAQVPMVDDASMATVVGPWYRPVAPRSDIDIGRTLHFAAEVTVTPWYRAAN